MNKDAWARLTAPFPAAALEWKVQKTGIKSGGELWALVVPYLDARAIQHRLDEVCGPSGWRVSYVPIAIGPRGGFVCELSILSGDLWVVRQDGADLTDLEPIKGGISGAFKRAAVAFGVGSYLYKSPPVYAEIGDGRPYFGVHKSKSTGERHSFRWGVPAKAVELLTREVEPAPPRGRDLGIEGPEPSSRPAAPQSEPVPSKPLTTGDGRTWPDKCPRCGAAMFDNRAESNPNMKCKRCDCAHRVYADHLERAGADAQRPARRDADDEAFDNEAFGPPQRSGGAR